MYDQKNKLLLYKSLIESQIDYCSSVLFLLNEGQLSQLQKIQNRAMRAILKSDYRTSVQFMLNKLKLLDIKQKVTFNTLILIFKIQNGLLPPYLKQFMNQTATLQPYPLRSNALFRLPPNTSARAKNSLFYKGTDLYNKLVKEYGQIVELKKFKAVAREYVTLNVSSH